MSDHWKPPEPPLWWAAPPRRWTPEEWEREREAYEREQIDSARSEADYSANVKEANK